MNKSREDRKLRRALVDIGLCASCKGFDVAPKGYVASDNGPLRFIAPSEEVVLGDGEIYEKFVFVVCLSYTSSVKGDPVSNHEVVIFDRYENAVVALKGWYEKVLKKVDEDGLKIVRVGFEDESMNFIECNVETRQKRWHGIVRLRTVEGGASEVDVMDRSQSEFWSEYRRKKALDLIESELGS